MAREMFRVFAHRMTFVEVETACGAGYAEVRTDRVNSRIGLM
jgi:hypothetical protein